MEGLITIGRLANLVGVTAKTLRHYEKLGLVEPDYIDPLTAYRYYSLDQVKNIYEILSLKKIGLSLIDIKNTSHSMLLKSKLMEVKTDTEKKIGDLQELLTSIDERLDSINCDIEEDLKIEYLHLEERRVYVHSFKPIDEVDSPELYMRVFEMEKSLPSKEKSFRGAVLDREFFRRGRYRCVSLFQELEDYSDVSQEEVLILPQGVYLSLWYRGNTVEKNEKVMKKAMEYISRNKLQLEGRIIGFAHRGAHTKDSIDKYESEIQIFLK